MRVGFWNDLPAYSRVLGHCTRRLVLKDGVASRTEPETVEAQRNVAKPCLAWGRQFGIRAIAHFSPITLQSVDVSVSGNSIGKTFSKFSTGTTVFFVLARLKFALLCVLLHLRVLQVKVLHLNKVTRSPCSSVIRQPHSGNLTGRILNAEKVKTFRNKQN